MSVAEALRAARAAGIEVSCEGDDLALEADLQPPAKILELLARHKPGIVALLRPGRGGWSAEDWQAHFDERAGIVADGTRAPIAWCEGFARLDPDRPSGDVPLERWRQFVDDAGQFIDRGWAARAVEFVGRVVLPWEPLA